MARGFVDPDDPYNNYSLEELREMSQNTGFFSKRLRGQPGSEFYEKLQDYENTTPFDYANIDDLKTVNNLPEINQEQGSVNVVANYFESITINDDGSEGLPPGSYSPSRPSIVPTSTLDPSRPRTVAAGYNSKTKIMTVVFRDGTWWNYFQVPQTVWNNFKTAYSKGRYLYAHGFDDRYGGSPIRFQGQRAASNFISQQEQNILATRARAVQQYTEGLQPGFTSSGQRRAMSRGYGQNRQGGTASRRRKRTT